MQALGISYERIKNSQGSRKIIIITRIKRIRRRISKNKIADYITVYAIKSNIINILDR